MKHKALRWLLCTVLVLAMVASLALVACKKDDPEPQKATATFVGGDGATGTVAPIEGVVDQDITLPQNSFSRDGYTFAGWNDGTQTYQAGAKYKLTKDVTFTAQWTKSNFADDLFDAFATFEYAPGVIGNVLFTSEDYGQMYPDWAGYSMVMFTFDEDNDIIEWGNSYSGLLYKFDNGELKFYDVNDSYELVEVEDYVATIDGNRLTIDIDRDIPFTETHVDMTLELDLYKLTISGTLTDGGDYWLTEGTSIGLFIENATGAEPTGYKFNGEEMDQDSPTYYEDYVMPAEASTLEYLGMYTVTYSFGDPNHAAKDAELPEPSEAAEGGSVELPQYYEVEAAEGWKLTGWKDADGEVYDNEYTMPDHDVTLTAVWGAETYALYWDLGFHAIESEQDNPSFFDYSRKELGAQFELPSIKTNDGWVFTHWEDEDGKEYQAGETFTMPAHTVTLTAQYEPAPVVNFTEGNFDGWLEFSNGGTRVLGLLFAADGSLTAYGLNGNDVSFSTRTYDVEGNWLTINLDSGVLSLQIEGDAIVGGGGSFTLGGDEVTVTGYTAHMYELTYDGHTLFVAAGAKPLVAFDPAEGDHVIIDGNDEGAWEDWTMPAEDVSIEIGEALPVPTLDQYEGEWLIAGEDTDIEIGSSADWEGFKVEGGKLYMRDYDYTDPGNGTYGEAVENTTISVDKGKLVVSWTVSGIFEYEIKLTFDSETQATLSVDDGGGAVTATFTKKSGETIVKHTVTLKSDGSTIWKTVEVEDGQTLQLDEEPTAAGKTFYCWNDDNGKFDLSTPITENITLEASYRIRVDFDLDGGEGTLPKPEWASSAYSNVTLTLPEAEGYCKGDLVLAGWSDGSTTYKPGQEGVSFTKSVTLKAVWGEANPDYTVTYENGADSVQGDVPSPEKHKAGDTFNLPDNPFTYEGYTFDGWLVGSDSVAKAPGTQVTMPADDLTIKPKWTVIKITVKFDPNGGSGSMNAQETDYGKDLSIPLVNTACTFTAPEGKEFAGWSLSASGEIIGNTTRYWRNIKDSVQNDNGNYSLTLYAIWITPLNIADFEGVWTDSSSDVIISAGGAGYEGTDGTTLGSIMLNNEVLYLYDKTTSLYAYSSEEEYYITKTDEGISINGQAYTKKAAVANKTLADFEGTWKKGETTHVLTISADSLEASFSNECDYFFVDKYLVVNYIITYGYTKNSYQYVLELGDNQLVGYYIAPQAEPAAVTFDKQVEEEPITSLDKFAGTSAEELVYYGFDKDASEGNRLVYEQNSKSYEVYAIGFGLYKGSSDQYDRFYVHYFYLLDGVETTGTEKLYSSAVSSEMGRNNLAQLAAYSKLGGKHLAITFSGTESARQVEIAVLDMYEKPTSTKVVFGQFTPAQSGEEEESGVTTFTGDLMYEKSGILGSSTTYHFTEIKLDVTQEVTTVHITVTVAGTDKSGDFELSKPQGEYSGEGTAKYYYTFYVNGVDFNLAVLEDGSVVICDQNDAQINNNKFVAA